MMAEEENSTPSSTKKTKMILIGLGAIILLAVGGFFVEKYVLNKAGEELIEQSIENGSGADVNVTDGGEGVSVQTESGSSEVGTAATWPSDLPGDIPKFEAGKLVASTKVETEPASWSLVFSDIAVDDVTKYKNDLTAKGWAVSSSSTFGTSSLSLLTKSNLQISMTYDGDSKGLSISVSYKSQ